MNRPWTAPGVSNSVAARRTDEDRRAACQVVEGAHADHAPVKIEVGEVEYHGAGQVFDTVLSVYQDGPVPRRSVVRVFRDRYAGDDGPAYAAERAGTAGMVVRYQLDCGTRLERAGRDASQRPTHQVAAVIGDGLEPRMVQVGYEREPRGVRVGAGPCCQYVAPPVHFHGEPGSFASGLYVIGAAVFVIRDGRQPPERGERTQRVFSVDSFAQWSVSR